MSKLFALIVESRADDATIRPDALLFRIGDGMNANDATAAIKRAVLKWLRSPKSGNTLERLKNEFRMKDLVRYHAIIPDYLWAEVRVWPVKPSGIVVHHASADLALFDDIDPTDDVKDAVRDYLNDPETRTDPDFDSPYNVDQIASLCATTDEKTVARAVSAYESVRAAKKGTEMP